MMKFNVNGQMLTVETPLIVADSKKYLSAEFTFSDDWNGCAKTVHFRQGECLLKINLDSGNKIEASKGLNLTSGSWVVSVVGMDSTRVITTNVIGIQVERSGICNGKPFDVSVDDATLVLQNATGKIESFISNCITTDGTHTSDTRLAIKPTPTVVTVAEEYEVEELRQQFQKPIAEQIDNWLDAHPEATTTVQDGSLTHAKLVKGTLGFVTPEMFGAVGDGVTDDTTALTEFFNNSCGLKILRSGKTYSVTSIKATSLPSCEIIGYGSTIKDRTSVITSSNNSDNILQDFATRDITRSTSRIITIKGLTIKGNASNYSFETYMSSNGCSLINLIGFDSVHLIDCNFSDSGQVACVFENVLTDAIFENCTVVDSGLYVASGAGKTQNNYFRWEGISVINNPSVKMGERFIVSNCSFDNIHNSPATAHNFKKCYIDTCTIKNSETHIFEVHPDSYTTKDIYVSIRNVSVDRMSQRLLTVEGTTDVHVRVDVSNVIIKDFGYPIQTQDYSGVSGLMYACLKSSSTTITDNVDVFVTNLRVNDYASDTKSHELQVYGNLTIKDSFFDMKSTANSVFMNVSKDLSIDNSTITFMNPIFTRAQGDISVINSKITYSLESDDTDFVLYPIGNCTIRNCRVDGIGRFYRLNSGSNAVSFVADGNILNLRRNFMYYNGTMNYGYATHNICNKAISNSSDSKFKSFGDNIVVSEVI